MDRIAMAQWHYLGPNFYSVNESLDNLWKVSKPLLVKMSSPWKNEKRTMHPLRWPWGIIYKMKLIKWKWFTNQYCEDCRNLFPCRLISISLILEPDHFYMVEWKKFLNLLISLFLQSLVVIMPKGKVILAPSTKSIVFMCLCLSICTLVIIRTDFMIEAC